jgi:hypothetical protein
MQQAFGYHPYGRRGFSWRHALPGCVFSINALLGHHPSAPISHKTPYNCFMETLSRLNALVGKQGLLKIRLAGEVGFTFLSVDPAPNLPTESIDEAIQTTITRSHFLVRFDRGTLIDGRRESFQAAIYPSSGEHTKNFVRIRI